MDTHTAGIPVNTRAAGDSQSISEGIYVLYLEDYVYTFIKKLVYESGQGESGAAVILYGRSFEQNSQKILVASGAALSGSGAESFFHDKEPLCAASACRGRDNGIRLELSVNGAKVILEDFYIYYDQNEEMQNYLIEWNGARHTAPQPVIIEETPRSGGASGVMFMVCMGIAVCVLAYGVIAMNSYEKLQGLQDSIDYFAAVCSSVISGNAGENDGLEPDKAKAQIIKAEEIEAEEIETEETEAIEIESAEAISEEATAIETETAVEAAAMPEAEESEIEIESEQPQEPDTAEATASAAASASAIPQYYAVQPGDTLRGICFSVYGDYSRVDEVCEINGIENPDSIYYGQKLLLP